MEKVATQEPNCPLKSDRQVLPLSSQEARLVKWGKTSWLKQFLDVERIPNNLVAVNPTHPQNGKDSLRLPHACQLWP